jgi:hypothetical protein
MSSSTVKKIKKNKFYIWIKQILFILLKNRIHKFLNLFIIFSSLTSVLTLVNIFSCLSMHVAMLKVLAIVYHSFRSHNVWVINLCSCKQRISDIYKKNQKTKKKQKWTFFFSLFYAIPSLSKTHIIITKLVPLIKDYNYIM